VFFDGKKALDINGLGSEPIVGQVGASPLQAELT